MRALRIVAFIILCGSYGTRASAMDLTQIVEFHIDPQRLATALLEFYHQANIEVIVAPEVGNRNSAGLVGRHSLGQTACRSVQ
jgi:hypothetical protein